MTPSHITGDESIGRRVRERRLELNLSQEGLAKRAGKAASTISAVERGARGLDVEGLQALARALDTTVGWLMGEPSLPRRVADQWATYSATEQERFVESIEWLMEKFGRIEEEEPPA